MMFGCEETRRFMDAWVDGELDPGAALLVETHIARCGSCAEEADMIHTLKRAMGSLREADQAPASLRTRLSAALDAEDAAADHVVQSGQRRKHAAGFMLAGAAIAGFVLATNRHENTTGGAPLASAGMMFAPVVEDITQRHARDLPLEVSGNQPEQVSNFFRGRLDIPVRPMYFRGVTAQLLGARISNVRDRMAAALYYDVGGRRATVFVFDSSLLPRQGYGVVRRTVDNRVVYMGNANGYNVAFSERGGVGYAVTTDLPPQDTLRLVANADWR